MKKYSLCLFTSLGLAALLFPVFAPKAVAQTSEMSGSAEEIARLKKAFSFFEQERIELQDALSAEQARTKELETRLKRYADSLRKNKSVISVYKKRLIEAQAGAEAGIAEMAATLQEKVDMQQSQLQQLGFELDKERQMRMSQEMMVQEREADVVAQRRELQSLTAELMSMKTERDRLLHDMALTKDRLDAEVVDSAGLADEQQQLRSQLKEAEQRTEFMKQREDQLTAALNSAQSEVLALQQQLSDESALYGAQKMEEMQRELQAMHQQLDDAEAALLQRQDLVRNQDEQESALREQIRILEKERADQARQLAEAVRTAERAAGEKEQLLQDTSRLEKALEAERARCSHQEELFRKKELASRTTDNQIIDLQNELQALRTERDALATDSTALMARCATLLDGKENAERHGAELEEHLHEAQAKLDDAMQMVETLSASRDAQAENVAVLKKSLQRERSKSAEMRAVDSDAEAEMAAELTKKVESLQEHLTAAENRADTFEQQARILQDKLATQQEQMAVLKQERDAVRSQKKDAEEMLRRKEALYQQQVALFGADSHEEGYAMGRDIFGSSTDEVGTGSSPVSDMTETIKEEVDLTVIEEPAAPLSEDALLEKAYEAYDLGDIDAAKETVGTLLQSNSKSPEGLGLSAIILWQEGQDQRALEQIEVAIRLNNHDAKLFNYLGIIQNSMGHTDDAAESFTRAIELDGAYDEPMFNLSVVLATLDPPQLDAARRQYENALRAGSERNESLEEILY